MNKRLLIIKTKPLIINAMQLIEPTVIFFLTKTLAGCRQKYCTIISEAIISPLDHGGILVEIWSLTKIPSVPGPVYFDAG